MSEAEQSILNGACHMADTPKKAAVSSEGRRWIVYLHRGTHQIVMKEQTKGMFLSKPVTQILNINPQISIQYMALSTMYINHTKTVTGHLQLFGNEVILFLPKHSGNYAP